MEDIVEQEWAKDRLKQLIDAQLFSGPIEDIVFIALWYQNNAHRAGDIWSSNGEYATYFNLRNGVIYKIDMLGSRTWKYDSLGQSFYSFLSNIPREMREEMRVKVEALKLLNSL